MDTPSPLLKLCFFKAADRPFSRPTVNAQTLPASFSKGEKGVKSDFYSRPYPFAIKILNGLNMGWPSHKQAFSMGLIEIRPAEGGYSVEEPVS
jgi:hypothetical protein